MRRSRPTSLSWSVSVDLQSKALLVRLLGAVETSLRHTEAVSEKETAFAVFFVATFSQESSMGGAVTDLSLIHI